MALSGSSFTPTSLGPEDSVEIGQPHGHLPYTMKLMPQLLDEIDNFILKLDGAPLKWSANVRDNLNEHLPHRWIGRDAYDYNMSLPNDHPEFLN
ncbi:hypothetical protein TNCV_4466411 [Trichonephila clavipes]|nr:hypothetical protein TNCV_4466411 [Trichonephila clavipes]